MNVWSHIGLHDCTVRRMHEWQRLLDLRFPAWAPLLRRIERPAGLRFVGDFGAGEHEFELTQDDDGYVAIPIDGVTPCRLNATEAEFARLDLVEVLTQVRDAAGCSGLIEWVGVGVYQLGTRTIAGKSLALFAAPRGVSHLRKREINEIRAHRRRTDLGMVLVPDVSHVPSADIDDFANAKVALSELTEVPPWSVDLSPLVADARFEVPLTDPVVFFGSRHAIIVDPDQQRVWLEGIDLKLKADGHCYRLFHHLAERPRTAVPVKFLANQVLEAKAGDRLESKIVSDVKHELLKAIRSCLTGVSGHARIRAEGLITVDDGRATLNVDPSLVRVVRRLSER